MTNRLGGCPARIENGAVSFLRSELPAFLDLWGTTIVAAAEISGLWSLKDEGLTDTLLKK